jgi:hypothetical protein
MGLAWREPGGGFAKAILKPAVWSQSAPHETGGGCGRGPIVVIRPNGSSDWVPGQDFRDSPTRFSSLPPG